MTTPHDQLSDTDRRVIDRLAQDAQVIKEARMLPFEGSLTPEQLDQARKTVQTYIDRKEIDLELVRRQTNRSATSIKEWLANRWTGDNDKLARLLVNWVEQHARGESSGMPQGFITTSITQRMYALMREVHRTRTVGLIVGPAGVSKSVMCQACASGLIPGSVHIECTQGSQTAAQFAKLWARRLGVGHSQALGIVEEAIIRALRGTDRLQMIDESFYLQPQALNVVRDVHKQAGVPIVLVGTRDVEAATDDARQWYGQWARLISYRYDILESQEMDGEPLYTVEEIHRFAASMGLKLTGEGAERATEIACIPAFGGLGMVAMILLNARVICDHEGRRSISGADILGAYESMHGHRFTARLDINRSELAARVKVA